MREAQKNIFIFFSLALSRIPRASRASVADLRSEFSYKIDVLYFEGVREARARAASPSGLPRR